MALEKSGSTIFAFILGVIALPIILGAVALAGLFPSKATDDPPKWEAELGARALDASLERRSAGARNPFRPEDARVLLAGMAIYRMNCAGCHGGARGRSEWGAKGFYPRVPQFDQEPGEISPEEAFAAIHDGIRYSGMGAWKDLISEQEMWQAANFVSRMHSLPPAVNQQWRHPPRPSVKAL